jgi:HSP20 family molecular chaperone IbpA
MTDQSKNMPAQSVPVVEADVFDRMNETKELIAQRAYEIYQSRGAKHGFDQDDWLDAEGELLPKLDVDYDVSDSSIRLTIQVPGFSAADLEVEVGHRQVVVCGIHVKSGQAGDNDRRTRKVMRIIDLPVDVDPPLAAAALQGAKLQIVLPRLQAATASGQR